MARALLLLAFLAAAASLDGQTKMNAKRLGEPSVPKFYPPKIAYDSAAFQAFLASYQAFKQKHGCVYLREILDSVGCAINQLAYAAKPIALNYKPYLKNQDTTTALLFAIRRFIDENSALFHATSTEIVLNSIVEENGYKSVLFERVDYKNGYRAGGKTKGMIEFVVNEKGEIAVLASTAIRKADLPIEKVRFSESQITKSLLYRSFNIELDDKSFSYLVDRIEAIKVRRVCVYEVRNYEDIENELGELIERRLRSAEAHLAYEVEIDVGYKKPIARLYIDGFTGEELAIEYPFLE
ncbi:MAG: hypothetical protein RMM16_00025 [Chloroherpetonaceae bacterium]|nr:hypothetical protein [Chloroherpetonaceae bacterium]